MIDGLPGILNLASASGEELGTTSDIVTDALTGFGLQAKDSAHFADILASASSNSNTNVSMLGESFKYCSPVAGALGISAKDTSFALGLMANAGIKGSSAGTALRSSLVNLAKPTKKMKEAMDELGISLTDSKGNVKSGKVLFDELRQKFSKLSDAQKAQYSATIFGKEAMSGMLSIINASDKDYNNLYKNLSNCDGQAEKMSETMQKNLKGAITNLKSAFEEMQISIATAVVPILTILVKFLNKLFTAFNKLPQPVKSTIGLLIGGVALLSPVFLILGKIVSSVQKVAGAFRMLRTASGIFKMLPALITPHTAIIMAVIGGIAFAVYQVVKHWDKLKSFFSNLWKGIQNIFAKFWGWLKTFFTKWVPTILKILFPFISIPILIAKNWSGLTKVIKKICSKIGDIFKKGIIGWKTLFKHFGAFMGKVGHWICDGLLGGLKKGWDKVNNFIKKMANGIKKTFKKGLRINSPSKDFAEYGENTLEGYEIGAKKKEGLVFGRFKNLANTLKNIGKNLNPDTNFNLPKIALGGGVGSIGTNSFNKGTNKINVNPNITMHVHIADTGEKGTKQLTDECKSMANKTLKNTLVDLFNDDAFRD